MEKKISDGLGSSSDDSVKEDSNEQTFDEEDNT